MKEIHTTSTSTHKPLTFNDMMTQYERFR